MDKIKKTFAELRQKAKDTAPLRWSRKELGQINLFKGAHQETMAPILRDCQVRVLASGEVLLRPGDACPALYLVLSGRLRIEDLAGTTIRAGDSIGEMFLLEKTTAGATITALEATRLLVIERDAAWTLISKSHQIARNWLALFAERTRASALITGSEEFRTRHAEKLPVDDSTGLQNRQWLERMLPRYIARSANGKEPLGFLLIEIDNLPLYIERAGDEAGAEVEKIVAHTIVSGVRPTDLVVRYGEAQFAVVLPDADEMQACLVAERVRSAVQAAAPATISVGAVEYEGSTKAMKLLANAEAALNMAKTSGGNRVGVH